MYIEKITEAAEGKLALLKRPLLYIIKAIMGGAFISLGVIASYSAASLIYAVNPALAPMFVAIVFPLALISIIFFGGELFTTGTFIMSIGFFNRKVSLWNMLKVWGVCYFVNFVTIVTVISIWCATKSHPQGMFSEFVTSALTPRLNYSISQLLVRGALCNFVVCWAYYAALRITGDAAKFLMIYFCVFAFVISGMEHSVANIGFLTIGFFAMDSFPIMDAVKNIAFSTLGNALGAILMLSIPVYFLERKQK